MVFVTRWWVGVDNAWEQEKLNARKMPGNATESHSSIAADVRWWFAQVQSDIFLMLIIIC
jgi:hypothetical protein